MKRNEIGARLDEINARIAQTCARSGRSLREVTLIAVSKTVTADRIREAIEVGVHTLGENRVQEAAEKIPVLKDVAASHQVAWHLIGHLQSNKARRAIELFDVIHSVDNLDLGTRLDRIAGELNKRLPIFVQVNTGDEASKSGVPLQDTLLLCEQLSRLNHLELRGLMTVPPYFDNAEDARPFFRQLRELRDEALRREIVGDSFRDLSMGMSHDFEIAIEEGATFVRIGTAIFGERN